MDEQQVMIKEIQKNFSEVINDITKKQEEIWNGFKNEEIPDMIALMVFLNQIQSKMCTNKIVCELLLPSTNN